VLPKDWTTLQNIVGGFAAGMFGAVFNTPGDVIRSAQQKQARAARRACRSLCCDGGVSSSLGAV
jgi:hypothetical protein